jgi:hypothetical protein
MSLIVVYDRGAVSPIEILQGVPDGQQLVVVVSGSAHARQLRPFFDAGCAAVFDLDQPELVDRLRDYEPDGIVTFSELMLPAASVLAAPLGLSFHDAAVVERLTDKRVQRHCLRAAGVDPTQSVVLTRPDDWDAVAARVGLPVVVKPVHGVSSRNAILVEELQDGRTQVGRLLDEEGEVVVEQYLRGIDMPEPFGDYVSVETVVQGRERHHFATTGKLRLAPPFRECGHVWPPLLGSAEQETVQTLADQAIKALDVESGVLHTEIKLTPDGPRIIEVNGRTGGYMTGLARRAAGLDLVEVGVKVALGQPVRIGPLALDRVHFEIFVPAPVEPSIVTAVCSNDALKGIDGVVRRLPLVRPGDRAGGGWLPHLDMIGGEAPDHGAVASVVESVMAALHYEFKAAGRCTSRTAADLARNP